MENLFNFNFNELLSPERLVLLIRALILLVVGLPFIYLLKKWISTYITKHFTAQNGMVTGKIIFFSGLIFLFIMVLKELGFSLGPLFGAAGIVGIALGFASQTSVSNIISGFFLIGEQPFVVGDYIKVGETTGEVLSIDTLSIKLRTFENQYVRIPNENILKSEVKTLTRFPIRRADLFISIAYKEDIKKVKEILMDLAKNNPSCLQEPEPLIIFEGFGTSSIDLKFAVWVLREEFITVRSQLYEQVKERFDKEGVEIPFPHVSLYAGSASEPITVNLVNQKGDSTI